MRKLPTALLALALILLAGCSGDGGGDGGAPGSGGGSGTPPGSGGTPIIRVATLRGVFSAPSGNAVVLVDGQPATLSGSTWSRQVEVPASGGEVVVQLRVDGQVVNERRLAIIQPVE